LSLGPELLNSEAEQAILLEDHGSLMIIFGFESLLVSPVSLIATLSVWEAAALGGYRFSQGKEDHIPLMELPLPFREAVRDQT